MRIDVAMALTPSPEIWDRFDPATAHPSNTIRYADFHRRAGGFPVFLEARIDGVRASQWLLSRRRPSRFRLLSAAIESPCGPQVPERYLPLRDEIFRSFVEFLRRTFRVSCISLHGYALLRGLTPASLEGAGFRRIETFLTYVNRIGDDEAILAAFHPGHRNDARKGIREGLRYEPDLSVEEYLALSGETYRRSGGTGPSNEQLRAIREVLVPERIATISGVFDGRQLAAASVILHHGWNAFYLHGATAGEKHRGASAYIHFENMRFLRERGVVRYDFGGAREDVEAGEKALRISRFKARFGGERIESCGGGWP